MKYEFVVRMENSVDPDQLASDLELHCFQKRVFFMIQFDKKKCYFLKKWMELKRKSLSIRPSNKYS